MGQRILFITEAEEINESHKNKAGGTRALSKCSWLVNLFKKFGSFVKFVTQLWRSVESIYTINSHNNREIAISVTFKPKITRILNKPHYETEINV